jgi:hypothetical protein
LDMHKSAFTYGQTRHIPQHFRARGGVRCGVLTVLTANNSVFRYVTPCGPVDTDVSGLVSVYLRGRKTVAYPGSLFGGGGSTN